MTTKLSSVLVTEAAQKNALAIVRALGSAGVKVYVLGHHRMDISRFSRYCNGSLLIDSLDREIIATFIKSNSIDLVIPVGTNSIQFFVEHHLFFANKVKTLLPNSEQVSCAMSKQLTMEAANTLKIPTPKTAFPDSLEDAYRHSEAIGFPCVMKWLYEVGENVVDYAQTKEEFIKRYDSMCRIHGFDEKTGFPMVQEFVDGVGVGYFGLFFKGKRIDSYQHERIREAPPSGGVSACAKTVYYDDLEKYGESLLTHLKWNGVAMVEFKMRHDKSLVLMEVNPKFWGSLDLGLKAGINFPLTIIKLLNAPQMADFIGHSDYPREFRFQWPLDGEFKYMFASYVRFKEVIKDFFNPNVGSNLNLLSDPLPTLVQVLSILALKIRSFFRGLIK